MVSVSEMICTDVQTAPIVDSGQGAGKSGAETEELFAALLAALSCGLFASQGDASIVIQSPEQTAQSDVGIESALTVEGDVAAAADSAGGNGARLSKAVAAVGAATHSDKGTVPGAAGAADAAVAAASDETAPAQPAPVADGTIAGEKTVASLQPVDWSAEPELAAGQEAKPPPALLGQVESLEKPDETGSAAAEVLRSVTSISAAGSKVSAAGGTPAETESGAQPALPGESSAVPSGVIPARAALELGSEDSAPTGMQHEAQSGGSDSGSGSTEKLFLDSLAHLQEGRGQRAANISDNGVSRIENPGEARPAESIVEQTVRSVLLSVRAGSSQLRVRLWPEHLGELYLRLVFKDNVLTLDMNAQSTVVKNVIESNLGQLRQALHSSGVDVGRVSVTVDPDLASGGRFSRQTPFFQPFDDEWNRSYNGHNHEGQPPLERWLRGARRRHMLGRIDLVA